MMSRKINDQPSVLSTLDSHVTTVAPTSKDLILDAAQMLLARHGYAGLSMRELATESGVAKATIYHHFQDKDAIFRSVLERDMTLVHNQLRAAANEATDAVAKLSAVIRVYTLLMRERRTVIMSVLQEMSRDTSKLCTFIHERRNSYTAVITAILHEGIADGIFRPVNVEQCAFALIGIIHSFMIFSYDEAEPDPLADEQFIEETINLFLSGVKAPGQLPGQLPNQLSGQSPG